MKPVVSPPRLIDADDSVGDLMREAKRDYEVSLDHTSAWRRYRDRPSRSVWLRLAVPSLAVASAAAGWLVLYGHLAARSPDLVATAEPVMHRVAHAAPAASVALPSTDPAQEQVREPVQNGKLPRTSNLEPRGASPVVDDGANHAVAPPPSAPSVDCLAFARSGDAGAAERCFETQASSQDLSAEVALYELARLRRDVLGKPADALLALDEYARRFPKGNLSGEVLFSRLELLVKLGRNDDVIRASDELLKSASGAERAPEIHLLRGNVYSHALGDAASATREYALARVAPGRVGDEAAFLEAVNLEKLADPRAADAFQSYLARSDARHRVEAQAHLNALKQNAPATP